MSDGSSPQRRKPGEVRVAELANELGITSDEVLALARDRHVWAKSENSKISKENASLLRLVWRARKQVRERAAVEHQSDRELAIMRAHLGIDDRRYRRRKVEPQSPRENLTGTAAAYVAHRPGASAEFARGVAAEWTGHYLFTDTQAAAWWRAGLSSEDAELAVALSQLGISPKLLGLTIRGETILYRLQEGGIAPEQVARLLRNEGCL